MLPFLPCRYRHTEVLALKNRGMKRGQATSEQFPHHAATGLLPEKHRTDSDRTGFYVTQNRKFSIGEKISRYRYKIPSADCPTPLARIQQFAELFLLLRLPDAFYTSLIPFPGKRTLFASAKQTVFICIPAVFDRS